jgi:hypothetical protein
MMKKYLKLCFTVLVLLLPSMFFYQVHASAAQTFNLPVSVASTHALACDVAAATSTSTNAGSTSNTSLGVCSVSLVAYTAPYTVTVAMTQLTSAGVTIPFNAVTYNPGSLTWITVTPSTATATNQTFASSAAVTPISVSVSDTSALSMTWTPRLAVIVPVGQATGIYTATITHSLT